MRKTKPGMAGTAFLSFPHELILAVALHLGQKDRASLMRSCRHMYAVNRELLYKHDIDFDRCSALFWGAAYDRVETIEASLAYGADVNISAENDAEAEQAVDDEYKWFFTEEDLDADETRPAELWYWRPLHVAARFGNDKAVDSLLDHGADINSMSFEMPACSRRVATTTSVAGHTIADFGFCASIYLRAREESLSHLEDYGIVPRYFPLHQAICHGHESTARLLISRGASLQTSYSKYPAWAEHAWFDAARAGLVPLMRLIRSMSPETTDTEWATWPDPRGLHALHNMTFCTDEARAREVVSYLVGLGASLDGRYDEVATPENNEGGLGPTPLLLAAGRHNVPAARALLDAGASVEPQDEDDLASPVITALRGAPNSFMPSMVSLLVCRGASVDAQQPDGDTPLLMSYRWALQSEWPLSPYQSRLLEVWRILLEKGARTDIRRHMESIGKTPTMAECVLLDFKNPRAHHPQLEEDFVRLITPSMLSLENWQGILGANLRVGYHDLISEYLVQLTGRVGEKLGYRFTQKVLLDLVSEGLLEDNASFFAKLFLLGRIIRSDNGVITDLGVLELAKKYGALKVTALLQDKVLLQDTHSVVPMDWDHNPEQTEVLMGPDPSRWLREPDAQP